MRIRFPLFLGIVWWCLAGTATSARGGEARPELARQIYKEIEPRLEKGDPAELLGYLEKAVEFDPAYYPAWMAIGRLHDKMGNLKDARPAYAKVVDILSKKEDLPYDVRKDLTEAKRRTSTLKEALGGLQKIREEFLPRFREKAAALQQEKKPFDALRVWGVLLRIDPEDEEAAAAATALATALGPELARIALRQQWTPLPIEEGMEHWRVYSGIWDEEHHALIERANGTMVCYFLGPPRRDFILRGEVMLPTGFWGTDGYLIGRADWNGGGYDLGLHHNAQPNQERTVVVSSSAGIYANFHESWGGGRRRLFRMGGNDALGLIRPRRWQDVSLVFRGTQVQGRVDDKEVFNETHEGHAQGGIALRAAARNHEEGVRFRKLEVLEIDYHDAKTPLDAIAKALPPALVLQQRGAAVEAKGDSDRAVGWYLGAASQADAMEKGAEQRKLKYEVTASLRKLDTLARPLEKIEEEVIKDLEREVKDYKRKKQWQFAVEALTILSRLRPQQLEYGRDLLEAFRQRHMPEEASAPSGYDALWNGYDLEGWEVRSGAWYGKDGLLVGAGWGGIRLKKKYESFRLHLVYRYPDEEEDRFGEIRLHEHEEHHWRVGASISLGGPRAGVAQGTIPDDKYAEVIKKPDRHGRMREIVEPKREAPYKPGEWNVMEIQIKKHDIKVDLNDKTVYRTERNMQLPEYKGPRSRDLPQCLAISCRGRVEFKTIAIRGR